MGAIVVQQLAGAVLGLSLGTFPPSCDQISTNVHPSRHKEYAIGGDVELHIGGQRGARSCNCTNGGRRNRGGRKQSGHRWVCRGCYLWGPNQNRGRGHIQRSVVRATRRLKRDSGVAFKTTAVVVRRGDLPATDAHVQAVTRCGWTSLVRVEVVTDAWLLAVTRVEVSRNCRDPFDDVELLEACGLRVGGCRRLALAFGAFRFLALTLSFRVR